MMSIQQCQVKRRVSIRTPWHVQHRASSKVKRLDPKALYVIKRILKALHITTIAKLVREKIMFELRAVRIIVRRVPSQVLASGL